MLYVHAYLPFCLHCSEKLQFLTCKKTTASSAPAVPAPWAVTAGPMQDTRTPPGLGTGQVAEMTFLPILKLQDRDRSAEGAPNL